MKPSSKDIYFADIFRLLWAKKRILLLSTLGSAVLGICIALGTPAEFVSTVKMAPEGLKAQSSNGLGDLAAMAGIDLNLSNRTDAIGPILYPDVVSSTPFLVDLSQVKVPTGNTQKTLFDYVRKDLKAPWYGRILGLPGKLIEVIVGEKKGSSVTNMDPYQLTPTQDRVLSTIKKRIFIDVDKKKRVIVAVVKMQDPKVSAVVADSMVSFLNEFITRYRTEKAKRDYQFTLGLMQDAKKKYFDAQSRYAYYSDANNNVIKNSVTVERDRLFNEQQLAFSVYSNLAQQVEAAKIRVQEQTPCISVIEPARIPVYKSNMGRVMMVSVFALMGLFVSAAMVLALHMKSILRITTNQNEL